MKKTLLFLLLGAMSGAASAQSFKISDGTTAYLFPIDRCGEMVFGAGGTTMTAGGRTFDVTEFNHMAVTDDAMADNTVAIAFDGETATVTIAGNLAPNVSATVEGAHVVLTQSDAIASEIAYSVSGASTDGSLTLVGTYKSTVVLNGVSLTNPSGAALDIQNGKRIKVEVNGRNVLADGDDGGLHKGALNCKGHTEFEGSGILTVTGNCKHAIFSKEYVEINGPEIIIPSAVKDGINTNETFTISSGSVTATVKSNGYWDSEEQKTKSSAAIRAEQDIMLNGGMLDLTATGSGGKGISGNAAVAINGTVVRILTSGGLLVYSGGSLNHNYTGNTDRLNSNYKSSPKGIKAEGNIIISDGQVEVTTTGNGAEGIESKAELTINGGDVKVRANDDAINSSSHMRINGGNVDVISSSNDGLDSNGNLYIAGGKVMAFGASSPECGLDANEEGGYSVYFTGGEVLAAGGGNSVPRNSTESTQPYLSLSSSLTAGAEVTVSTGSTTLATFTIPTDYKTSSGGRYAPRRPAPGGWGPGGWGPGGGSGGGLLITCPGLTTGISYTVTINGTATSATPK